MCTLNLKSAFSPSFSSLHLTPLSLLLSSFFFFQANVLTPVPWPTPAPSATATTPVGEHIYAPFAKAGCTLSAPASRGKLIGTPIEGARLALHHLPHCDIAFVLRINFHRFDRGNYTTVSVASKRTQSRLGGSTSALCVLHKVLDDNHYKDSVFHKSYTSFYL